MISDTETFAQGLTKRERVWLMAWETSVVHIGESCHEAVESANGVLADFDEEFPELAVASAPVKPIVFGPVPHLNPLWDIGDSIPCVDRKGGEV